MGWSSRQSRCYDDHHARVATLLTLAEANRNRLKENLPGTDLAIPRRAEPRAQVSIRALDGLEDRPAGLAGVHLIRALLETVKEGSSEQGSEPLSPFRNTTVSHARPNLLESSYIFHDVRKEAGETDRDRPLITTRSGEIC